MRVMAKPSMDLTIAPIEIRPFQLVVLVLELFLVVPKPFGLVKGTMDTCPPDRGWGIVAPVT